MRHAHEQITKERKLQFASYKPTCMCVSCRRDREGRVDTRQTSRPCAWAVGRGGHGRVSVLCSLRLEVRCRWDIIKNRLLRHGGKRDQNCVRPNSHWHCAQKTSFATGLAGMRCEVTEKEDHVEAIMHEFNIYIPTKRLRTCLMRNPTSETKLS